MAHTRRTLRPHVIFRQAELQSWRANRSFVPTHCIVQRRGLRPIRRIQAMTFSKLPPGVPLAAFVFCVFALLGPSTGPLLADGAVAPHSFQSGGVSTLEAGAVSARPGSNPDRISNPQANNKFSNNHIFRRGQVVVQACKPSGAACSLPGECCSNSCVPPGFGGEPTCR
jgi:hypothetical protein